MTHLSLMTFPLNHTGQNELPCILQKFQKNKKSIKANIVCQFTNDLTMELVNSNGNVYYLFQDFVIK